MAIMLRLGVLLVVVLPLSGCSDMWCWPFECSSSKSSSGVADTSTTTTTTTSDTSTTTTSDTSTTTTSDTSTTANAIDPNPSAFDLSKVHWLHPQVPVRNWPITSTLSVAFTGGRLCLNFSGTSTWPTAEIRHTSGTHNVAVNANPWVFVSHNGTWYGGIFEWLVPNGNCLPLHTVAGDHVKHAPLNGAWKPQSGEKLYFMVSSIAYIWNMNNYEGRTNVVEVIWP